MFLPHLREYSTPKGSEFRTRHEEQRAFSPKKHREMRFSVGKNVGKHLLYSVTDTPKPLIFNLSVEFEKKNICGREGINFPSPTHRTYFKACKSNPVGLWNTFKPNRCTVANT